MNDNVEKEVTTALEYEWGQEGGFFFDYRDGKFNEDAYARTRNLLLRLDYRGKEIVSRKVIALIYSIPFFLMCNEELVVRNGGSRMLCEMAISEFSQLLINILEIK